MVKVKLDLQKNEWIVLPKGSRDGMYIDGFVYKTLTDAKAIMEKKDLDLPIAITGYPGSGKSTFGLQAASFLDPTFNVDRMCVDTLEFIDAIKKAKPLQAVVLDESFEGLGSTQIRRELGRALANLLNVVRQKRLYIFVILPNFFDLSKTVAIFRTRWLFHCYSESFGDIGKFTAFDRITKQKLYIMGKRFEDYNCVRADFYGVFSPYIPPRFDYQKYLNKKEQQLKNINKNVDTTTQGIKQRNLLIGHLGKEMDYTTKHIADISGVSIRNIQLIIKRHSESSKTSSSSTST